HRGGSEKRHGAPLATTLLWRGSVVPRSRQRRNVPHDPQASGWARCGGWQPPSARFAHISLRGRTCRDTIRPHRLTCAARRLRCTATDSHTAVGGLLLSANDRFPFTLICGTSFPVSLLSHVLSHPQRTQKESPYGTSSTQAGDHRETRQCRLSVFCNACRD